VTIVVTNPKSSSTCSITSVSRTALARASSVMASSTDPTTNSTSGKRALARPIASSDGSMPTTL
jgi:hypothetical protein